MAKALKNLPISQNKNLLVGFNKADDAGVYKINDELALVQTVDFFPPIVDDPYNFGRIAAANALSDIYAMGGQPLTALNIVAFPSNLPESVLGEILRGGAEKVEEAGAVIVGGHSIKDNELKYGISVTGQIDPKKIITNSGAKVGDKLYLTKPLGTGIITTGIKRGTVDKQLSDIVTDQMAALNKDAGELMVKYNANAATDITGYGLMGHTLEMAEGSEVTIRIFSDKLPVLPQALELAELKMIPGGANSNREFVDGKWKLENKIDKNLEHILFDPQTSGGLFISLPQENCEAFENELRTKGLPVHAIGQVEEKIDVPIIVE